MKTKIIPIPACPMSLEIILLEEQIRKEIEKCLVVPDHLLKPREVSTAVHAIRRFLEIKARL